jgi:hypothetical protein
MKQMTLAATADACTGSERFRKPKRRDTFLAELQTIAPWARLVALIEPHYPRAGNGRPPMGLERMLRIHLPQYWCKLADAACEEALYDSAALRAFVGIDLGREPVPDATTILKFRHPLERHRLGQAIFAELDHELPAAARPRDEANAEGQAVALWHEGTSGSGQQDRAGAQRRGHRRERARQASAARAAARSGKARLRRPRLPKLHGHHQGGSPAGARLHEPARAQARR